MDDIIVHPSDTRRRTAEWTLQRSQTVSAFITETRFTEQANNQCLQLSRKYNRLPHIVLNN